MLVKLKMPGTIVNIFQKYFIMSLLTIESMIIMKIKFLQKSFNERYFRYISLQPFVTDEKSRTEKLNNFLKVAQLLKEKVMIF